ncbi:MAG TPA: hypothetical protein VGM90_40350 [Kofleriaceae bacterium]|jgi:hypothetical protein
MKLTTVTVLAFATLSLVACGGGGSDGDISTEHEGIYAVSSWTGTTNGCSGPATPIAPPDSRTDFYVQSATSFGTSFINLVGCDAVASCQALAESSTITQSVDGWRFTTGSDAAWTGTGGFVSSPHDHVCTGTSREATLVLTGTTAHVESRDKVVTWPAPASEECDQTALEEHAPAAACTTLVTVDATFAAEL